MKPYARGKSIILREIKLDDAEFVISLRTDQELGRHLSTTSVDIEHQESYIKNYLRSPSDYYFIITDHFQERLGTVRIYDIRGSSFCWGSWILRKNAPSTAAIESALLIYDFSFFALHFDGAHFDVRKANSRVVNFHRRFGASVVNEDDINYYFEYKREDYLQIRPKYARFLP
jgi:hypothetical protein